MQFVLGADFALAITLIVLLTRRNGARADRWLVFALAVLGFIALGIAITDGGWDWPFWLHPLSIIAGASAFFLPPVALYLYIRDATGTSRRSDLFWFAPALINFIWLEYEALFGGGVVFDHGFAGVLDLSGPLAWLISPLSVVFSLVFPLVGLRVLARHRRALMDNVATLDGLDLAWSRTVLLSMIAGGLAGAVLLLLANFQLGVSHSAAFAAILVIIGGQLGFAGYSGLQQVPPPVVEAARFDPAVGEGGEAARADYARLDGLMCEQALHTSETFRLDELAAAAGWPPERVSHALKLGGETNFHDFANRHRVEAVKALIDDPANARISLLALALDAGFQSKASFNRVFKAVTGETPTAYRRRAG